MKLLEQVPLREHTTLRVGGTADFYSEIDSSRDLEEVCEFAREQNLPVLILGRGSNLLVSDEGVRAVVVKPSATKHTEIEQTDSLLIEADAGASWEEIVKAASAYGVFGVENLAAIPGSVGGAVVQNIGAYGAELSSVFSYAEVIDITTGESLRIEKAEARFGYRTSIFKERPELLIMRVGLSLSKTAQPNLVYADVVRAQASGTPLNTPEEIANAIRVIRSKKFPDLTQEGTAGSFFKNPVVSQEIAHALTERFKGLPAYPQSTDAVKVSLAWILDNVLNLKGYSRGPVRLYEEQPLVIVTSNGATSHDVESFAEEIATRVQKEIGITIEREVETFNRMITIK